jgi:hypothetical protein
VYTSAGFTTETRMTRRPHGQQDGRRVLLKGGNEGVNASGPW